MVPYQFEEHKVEFLRMIATSETNRLSGAFSSTMRTYLQEMNGGMLCLNAFGMLLWDMQ